MFHDDICIIFIHYIILKKSLCFLPSQCFILLWHYLEELDEEELDEDDEDELDDLLLL